MAVALRGDFDRLERLVARAGRIASPAFRRQMLGDMAKEVNRQIGIGFDRGQDPNGNAWQPLRFGSRSPLVKSGKLKRKAQNALPTIDGVMVQVDLVYAATHQYGATIRARKAKFLRFRAGRRWIFAKQVTIPARPFLPSGELPQRWREALANVVVESLRLTLTGV